MRTVQTDVRTVVPSHRLDRRAALARLGGGGIAAVQTTRDLRPVLAQDATPEAATEENEAIVRRVFEAVNANTPYVIDELYAPDFVDRSALPGQTPGPAGIKQAIVDFHALLPDVHVTVEAMIAEGDLVATR